MLIDLDLIFNQYEDALVRHDVTALDKFFWYDPKTVRYGVAENLYGGEAIRAYRMARPGVSWATYYSQSDRRGFGRGFGAVSAEFTVPNSEQIGRQMQTWIRFPEGWRIVAAHVSVSDTFSA